MGQPRYINTSERSVALLEGAYILGQYLNKPYGDPETLRAWNNWKETWKKHPKMIDMVEHLQRQAFNLAQEF